jgi:hypothetical protein
VLFLGDWTLSAPEVVKDVAIIHAFAGIAGAVESVIDEFEAVIRAQCAEAVETSPNRAGSMGRVSETDRGAL